MSSKTQKFLSIFGYFLLFLYIVVQTIFFGGVVGCIVTIGYYFKINLHYIFRPEADNLVSNIPLMEICEACALFVICVVMLLHSFVALPEYRERYQTWTKYITGDSSARPISPKKTISELEWEDYGNDWTNLFVFLIECNVKRDTVTTILNNVEKALLSKGVTERAAIEEKLITLANSLDYLSACTRFYIAEEIRHVLDSFPDGLPPLEQTFDSSSDDSNSNFHEIQNVLL